MYRVMQQFAVDDPVEVSANKCPKLALAGCLCSPISYDFVSIAFPGDPPELVDLDTASLDHLVAQIEAGRLLHATFRRPGAAPELEDIHQFILRV